MLQPTEQTFKNILRLWGWQVLQRPPHSPDLSQCDCSAATYVSDRWQRQIAVALAGLEPR
jgi:hypothetical protein